MTTIRTGRHGIRTTMDGAARCRCQRIRLGTTVPFLYLYLEIVKCANVFIYLLCRIILRILGSVSSGDGCQDSRVKTVTAGHRQPESCRIRQPRRAMTCCDLRPSCDSSESSYCLHDLVRSSLSAYHVTFFDGTRRPSTRTSHLLCTTHARAYQSSVSRRRLYVAAATSTKPGGRRDTGER
ncbi:hypothetical protein OH76DRAFT_314977 [Lentinus brumalis]|uniref:Uncharacterized protein n=1 Tax=Lentinus brumalis TaxID=2498619 RepID=A0A371CJW7_9APHY|nr:hypothetical protein OH76DRAFT_314977 [Polyporus brumalis]